MRYIFAKMRLIPLFGYVVLLFLSFACKKSYKEELAGYWEAFRVETFVKNELQTSTEGNFQFYLNDTIAMQYLGDIGEIYTFHNVQVSQDTLFLGELDYRYTIVNDTLQLFTEVGSEQCSMRLILYLAKIPKNKWTVYSYGEGLIGDWELVSEVFSEDSTDHNFPRSFSSMHVTEDSIYKLYNNQFLVSREEYTRNSNKLICQNSSSQIIWELKLDKDTLRLNGKTNSNYEVSQYFVRTNLDDGDLAFLLEKTVNGNYIMGTLVLDTYLTDTLSIKDYYPTLKLIPKIELKEPCEKETSSYGFNNDFLVKKETGEKILKLIELKSGSRGCYGYFQLNFLPVQSDNIIPQQLSYQLY